MGTVSKPCNGGSIGPAPVPQKILAELKVGEIPWIPWIFFLEKKTAQHENLEFRGGGGPWKTIFFWVDFLFCHSKLLFRGENQIGDRGKIRPT